TPQSHTRSPGTKSPSGLSRNSTSTALKEKSRPKDRETETGDAGEPGAVTAAVAGTANDTGSSIDVTRSLSPAPAHTPGASSAIDPLSQVSAEDPARLVAPADIGCVAYSIAKEHRAVYPT